MKNELNYSWDSMNNCWYQPDNTHPVTYVGNTENAIDWEDIINTIKNNPGKILPRKNWDNPLLAPIHESLETSNYRKFSPEWINYYAESGDYDISIHKKFGQVVGKPNYARAWISRINPGKTAPWHWDIDDNELTYLSKGNLIRYSCKIGKIEDAHFTTVGGTCLSNGKSGDIYQWPDFRMWHGGANAGLVPKYQFNYLAYV